jgi:hypothetical protein
MLLGTYPLSTADMAVIQNYLDAMYPAITKRERIEKLRKVYEYLQYCLEQYDTGKDYDPTKTSLVEYWLSQFNP